MNTVVSVELIKPKKPIVIQEVQNGFIIQPNGSDYGCTPNREEIFVFNTAEELGKHIAKTMAKPTEAAHTARVKQMRKATAKRR